MSQFKSLMIAVLLLCLSGSADAFAQSRAAGLAVGAKSLAEASCLDSVRRMEVLVNELREFAEQMQFCNNNEQTYDGTGCVGLAGVDHEWQPSPANPTGLVFNDGGAEITPGVTVLKGVPGQNAVCPDGTAEESTLPPPPPPPPAECTTPWGETVANDDNVTAYEFASVPAGESCASQTRTCSDGSLSGTYTQEDCVVEAVTDAPCTTPWGTSVAHQATTTAYQTASVAFGQTCASQTRTCNNGTLSGNYSYANCSVGTASACTTPWGASVAHGANVTAYQSASVSYGNTCRSQSRTCNNGSLSGSYSNQNCSVGAASNCSAPWGGSVAHGSSVQAYQTASVAYGSSCRSQNRSCNNGTLSGSYTHRNCSVASGASCTAPWGATVTHGNSVTAYQTVSVAYGYNCANYRQTRTCNNGSLSGSYRYASCSTAAPPQPNDQCMLCYTHCGSSAGVSAYGGSGNCVAQLCCPNGCCG